VNWRTSRLAVIDTETTGIDPATARIVDLGVVIVENGEITERRGWLINPGVRIPAECTEVHGITDEMVSSTPSFAAIVFDFVAMVSDAIPVAFNARFDRALLIAEFLRADLIPPAFLLRGDDNAWIDALVWARAFAPYGKGQKLGIVAERLGVEAGQAHRAVGDCETTARVLGKLAEAEMHRDAGVARMPETFADLVLHQRRLTAKQDESFVSWLIKEKAKENAA
jgi:DNA polymerase III epsilon subunit family exonuclease